MEIREIAAVSFDISKNKELFDYFKNCEWGAGKALAEFLTNGKLFIKGDYVYSMTENGNIIAFLTLARTDCIDDKALFPWIGFVYTDPKYRGHRYSEMLINSAAERAKTQGYEKLYVATDHVGLYEKFGFKYLENRPDVYGEDSRILCKDI